MKVVITDYTIFMFKFFITSFFIVLFCCTQHTAQDLSQLKDIEKQLQNNSAKIKPKIKEKKRAEAYMSSLKKEIKYNELKLKNNYLKLKTIKNDEAIATKEYNASLTKFETLKSQFSDRIRQIYKQPPIDAIEIILSNENWVSNSETQYIFQKILQTDTVIIETLENQHLSIKKKKDALTKKRIDIDSLQKEIKYRESVLNKKKNAQTQYISNLKNQIQRLEKQNKELDRLSRELSKVIFSMDNADGYYGSGKFLTPVKGWISSRYGMRMHPIFKRRIKHTGIDIAAPKGYKIRAAESGKVIFSGTKGGYGKSVLIYHGKRPSDQKSISSFYAHASRLIVKNGDIVKKGDEIAYVGATGYATGPHLHFEVKVDGVHADPMLFLE